MSQIAVFRFLVLATTILGGLHGVVVTLRMFFTDGSQGVFVDLVLAAMLAVYLYVIAAGLIFWRHPNRVRPLSWAQVIQIPSISLPGLVYKCAVGLTSVVAVVFTHLDSEAGDKYSVGFSANWSLGSSWEVYIFKMVALEVGVNVVPLVILLLLRNVHRLTNQTGAAPSADSRPISAAKAP